MPDAFTFDEGNGSVRKFRSRAEMYDYMADNGHVIVEGDDADKFEKHCAAKGKAAALATLKGAKTWA